MSHVQIRTTMDGAVSLVVDGMEMALKTLAGSLAVEFPDDMFNEPVRVSMTILADTVDMDFVNADVQSEVHEGA